MDLSCRGTGMNMMFLGLHYFCVSQQESHTEAGHKQKKAKTRCLFKTPILEPWLRWDKLEAQAKSSKYRNQFYLTPLN